MRVVFLAFVVLWLTACGADQPAAQTQSKTKSSPTFVFTAIPDQDERRLRERFAAAADYLSAELGVPVRYVPVKSYSAAVTAFVNNEVQLAWFGGLSGVQARLRVPGARAIAQGAEDPRFHSVFIAHHSTGLKLAEELPDSLAGLSFSFGSKGSTSGRLMPEFFLRERFGSSPQEVFERVGFSGDHTRTVQLVQSGAWQVGALSYTVWDKEIARGNVDTDKVRLIWRSPDYPDYQWTIRGDVDGRFGEGFAGRVQQVLVELDDPELLERFARSDFIAASNEDYAPIEATARSIGLID